METVTSLGSASWEIGVVGLQSERFRRVTLTDEDITRLKVTTVGPAFNADGALVKLGLQSELVHHAIERAGTRSGWRICSARVPA